MAGPMEQHHGQPAPLSSPTPTPTTPTRPRTALRERSPSQNNKLGIRIVPYTPPRLVSGERPPSQVSIHSQLPEGGSRGNYGNYEDQEATGRGQLSGSPIAESHPTDRGSALSSEVASSQRLGRGRGQWVSGTKQGPQEQGPGAQPTLLSPRTAPRLESLSDAGLRNNSTSAIADNSFLQRLQSVQQGTASQRSSVSSTAASTSALPQNTKSLSRSRNFVAVHPDKTFSLVKLRPTSFAPSDASSGIRSPPLSSVSYSSASSTQERPSIDAWSDAQTTALSYVGTQATPTDRVASELPSSVASSVPSSAPSSPFSSVPTVKEAPGKDATTSSPWNYQLVGGLRKVPKTPEVRSRHLLDPTIGFASTPDTLPALPEVLPPRGREEDQETPTRTLQPKKSFASTKTDSTTSESTNYKVYGRSPALNVSPPRPHDDETPTRTLQPKNSFSSGQTDLTTLETTNYKVYGHTPAPESLPDQAREEATPARTLESKISFSSVQSDSAASETTNYKVYGHSSAPESSESLPLQSSPNNPNYEVIGHSSPNNPNYEIIGQSSPVAAVDSAESSPPDSPGSGPNYVVHGEQSSPAAEATTPTQTRPSYSQESLKVPPLSLAAGKRRSQEKFGYYKQRSRDSLREPAGSVRSIKTGSSALSTQDNTQLSTVTPVSTNTASLTTGTDTETATIPEESPSDYRGIWSTARFTQAPLTASALASRALPPIPMIEEHPHVWSSQLSTVMSETEESSSVPSRSASVSTGVGTPTQRRRSSAGWASSLHSRQMPSISSSMNAPQEEDASVTRNSASASMSASASASDTLERPRPTHTRSRPSLSQTVRDQDEHGDGITDLYDTSNQASRSGLSFFTHTNSSSRNLHSSSSSRANSMHISTIPAWARLYYGSGERRLPRAPSISTLTESYSGGDSRPGSAMVPNSPSPNNDHFPLGIYGRRHKGKRGQSSRDPHPLSDQENMDVENDRGEYGIMRTLRHKTSSLWSPHLQMDRRTEARFSMWEPPSVNWSAESGMLGKRNSQLVLFALGFVFPFAWMIAAVLPLPHNPKLEMLEHEDMSQMNFGSGQINFTERTRVLNLTRYESARWWRNINRFMSIVGLLIIGAIIALVVIGLRQGWVVKVG